MRFALLLVLVPTVALAEPLAMKVGTHGSFLDLSFTNTSNKPIKMTTHVRAGLRDHHDWLTVKLTGKTKRTLKFIETRTKAIPVDATIAPGKSVVRSIDLAVWAIHWDNGDPLAPDTYEVEATWEQDKRTLVAKTKLVIAAPIENGCKEAKPSTTGIELLARQIGSTTTIEVGLHNADKVTHCVAGYIATHEQQSDWLTVHLDKRKLVFHDSRDKSAPMPTQLAPGATAWTKWDLAAWAKRGPNGKAPLASVASWAIAVYDATREKGQFWNGAVKTTFGFKAR